MSQQQGQPNAATTTEHPGENNKAQQVNMLAQDETALSAAPEAAAAETAAAAAASDAVEHAFETDPGDHAETPFQAYEHLDLLLTRLATRLGTTKAALRIYDPFFCEGRMVQHLAALGYASVYNRNEDFYAVKAAGSCPEFNVLLTNPPFSGDHLERIFRFAVKSNKPWFLLVPQYVARKAFFLEWVNHQRPKGVPRPSYVAPTQEPYVFTAPSRADVLQVRAKEPTAPANHSSQQDATSSSSLEQKLSELSVKDSQQADSAADRTAAVVAADERETAALAAAAAAQVAPAEPSSESRSGFDVAAGSFQCVWFFNLGERHHKPVCEWVQQQQQQQQQQAKEQGGAAVAAPAYCVVSQMRDVPQLMAAPKLTPAERRWRKKQAALAAAGQLPDEQQPQQPGGGSGGRQGSGRQQQLGGNGRPGGRQQQQRPLGGGRQPGGARRQQQQQQHKQSRGSQFSVLEELL